MLKNAFNKVAGMESMALFAEISGVQPKFASVQYNEVRTSSVQYGRYGLYTFGKPESGQGL